MSCLCSEKKSSGSTLCQKQTLLASYHVINREQFMGYVVLAMREWSNWRAADLFPQRFGRPVLRNWLTMSLISLSGLKD